MANERSAGKQLFGAAINSILTRPETPCQDQKINLLSSSSIAPLEAGSNISVKSPF